MTRPFVLFGLLLIGAAFAAPPGPPEKETPKNRRDRWQYDLDQSPFKFRGDEASAVYCVGQYVETTRMQMIYDSEKWTALTFRFGPDGDLLVLRGNWGSVFKASHNVLFFAHYHSSTDGCTITAYDLNNGKQLWEMPLHPLGLIAHSAYGNEVNLDLPFGAVGTDQVVSVKGHESYGDYQEVLDMKTGEELAHKVYRKGWK